MMSFGILCILLGLALAAAGLSSVRKEKRERGSCTERVTATVIGHEESLLKDDTGTETWAFCPRFRYVVRNTPTEATADWGTLNPRFHEGQHVPLYYDPKDPSHIYVYDQKGTTASMRAAAVFGILLILAGIACILFL